MRADFTSFYETEASRLVRSLALAIDDPVLAEDAAAEAFARAWARWPEVSTRDSPSAWVMRVALNQARDRFRRRRVERRKASAIARADVVHDPQPHLDLRLWHAVRDLPEQERTLVALRYVADLPQTEIARLLGLPPGTVASALSRARHKLGVALGTTYQEELT
ncbi:MAG: sigma-70 family RNA polymerase sigma factor [Acidimicrobiales bacterium]